MARLGNPAASATVEESHDFRPDPPNIATCERLKSRRELSAPGL